MSRAARSSGVIAVGGLAARLAVNPANVVMIDPSIDTTGQTEVSALLKPYATDTTLVPDGTPLLPTIVRFQPGALYNSEDVWQYTHRFNVKVDFNGGELRANVATPYGLEMRSDIAAGRLRCVAHGMDGTKPFQISFGLSNTKGITARTTLWPVQVSPDSFGVATSLGGPPIVLTGTADNAIQVRNAAAPNPRAFLFSTDFPGNANFARCQLVMEGCTNCEVTDLSGNGGTVTGAQFNGATPGTRSSSGSYDARYAGQVGILLLGGTNCQVGGTVNGRITIQYTLGDSGENIASSTYGPGVFLRWHDLNMIGAGRQGWSVGNGGATGVVLEDSSIIGAAHHLRDIEADNPDGSADIVGVVMRRLYLRCGTDTLGDLAMGGESKVVTDIVNGGLEGHPLDGNLTVGTNNQSFCMDVDSPFPDDQGPVRRGPLTFNYNVGGGQIQLTTHQGSLTAEYTGVLNPTSFTDTQLLQFQPISASTLPTPCQINSVDESTRTVTLSHPAQSGGTQTVTATFGGVCQGVAPLNLGNFTLRSGWDGITGIGNIFVVQSGPAFDLDYCSGYLGNIHDNIVIGGTELRATNPYVPTKTIALTGFAVPRRFGTDAVNVTGVSAGGKVAVRAGMGQQQPQFNFIASVTSHWDSAGTVSWPRNWNFNTCVETDSSRACATDSTGFGVPGRPRNVFRVAAPAASFLNHSQDGKLDTDAANLQLAYQRQGNVPQVARFEYEFDGGWMPWSIGGQTQSGSPNNPTPTQINQFCQGVQYAVNRMLAVCPTLLIDLCGSLGYGDPNNIFGHGHTVWDAVMNILGGTFDGGIIRYFDTDAYSNGPPGGSWLQTEMDMIEARCVAWGCQVAHGEFGIGGTISPVVSQAPHNWQPGPWGTAFVNWWKSLPASGRGSFGRVEIFDIGGDGVFLDGRGGVLVPNGEGPAFAAAIENGLL